MPLPSTFTLSVREGAEQGIRAELPPRSRLRRLPKPGLFILELEGGAESAQLLHQRWRQREYINWFQATLRDEESGALVALTDELIVQFRDPQPVGWQGFLARFGLTFLEEANPSVPNQVLARVERPDDADVRWIVGELQKQSEVEFAEPNWFTELGR